VFDRADAAPSGAFPYAAGPLTTETLTFDPATGDLTGASPNSLSIAVPNGQLLTLDLSDASQLATDYTVLEAFVDGNAPSGLELLEIAEDGMLYASYANGQRIATYQIPLATVQSPDRLRPESGNIFQPTNESGDIQIGIAGQTGYGSIVSGALEDSTVDLATELTTVIESQRAYTANSRVFQTGSELLDVLVNLAR
jgi:flagellar hook protein FlgE